MLDCLLYIPRYCCIVGSCSFKFELDTWTEGLFQVVCWKLFTAFFCLVSSTCYFWLMSDLISLSLACETSFSSINMKYSSTNCCSAYNWNVLFLAIAHFSKLSFIDLFYLIFFLFVWKARCAWGDLTMIFCMPRINKGHLCLTMCNDYGAYGMPAV